LRRVPWLEKRYTRFISFTENFLQPPASEEPVEYQDERGRLRRCAQSRVSIRAECALIDRSGEKRRSLSYNGTIWGGSTLRGSGRLHRAMAWIESLTGVYKSACCRAASLFLLFSPFRVSIDRSALDRSPEERSKIGFNVGHRGKCRTHVRVTALARSTRNDGQLSSLLLIYCRSLDRGYYNHEEILRGYLWSVFATPRHTLRSTREEVSKVTDPLYFENRPYPSGFVGVLFTICSIPMQSRRNSSRSHES